MINPDAPTEVLPGFIRSDLQFLAECLEGRHGEGRRAEAAPGAARFIRAALARPLQQGYGLPRLMVDQRALTDNDLEAGVIGGPVGAPLALSENERRMIEKQRAHAERNRGDDNGDEGLPS